MALFEFPFIPLRRWFKGADTTLLALYLETFYAKILADCSEEVENVLTVIYDGLVAVNRFMTASYHEALWVKSHRASEISVQGMAFMEWFNEAAMEALRQEVPRFKLMPKFHFFAHLVHSMKNAATRNVDSLNCLAFSCQVDEDFVGRIAVQSRHVSIRSVHDRTVQRYCLNLGLRW